MEKINWYGMYTLTIREIKRFLKVYNQTVIAPVISALIFLAVFVLAIGTKDRTIEGIKFVNFMGYGLIIMSIVQNAFSNSSSSFIMSKVLGYISDILTPPLGSIEIIIALTCGSVVRGCMVGFAVTIALSPFVDYHIYHPFLLIFFIIVSCIFLGQIGILTGIITNNFDQNAAITGYLITPLSFLSGTFYSVKNLPEILQKINILNPFFYIIDGFRYCLTNHIDGNILGGAVYLIAANLAVFLLLLRLLNIGWRIKG
jgi:ABC-2 type transport system permease protein